MLRRCDVIRASTALFESLIRHPPTLWSDLFVTNEPRTRRRPMAFSSRGWECCNKTFYIGPVVEQMTGDSQTSITHGTRDVFFGERRAHPLRIPVRNVG